MVLKKKLWEVWNGELVFFRVCLPWTVIQFSNVLDGHDGNQTTVSCYLQCQMRCDENSKIYQDQQDDHGSE